MQFLLANWGTILLAILSLGILIVVHEGGHFLLARASKMRVDRFSVGFGPTIFSFKRGETLYEIAAIPLGGFVQIAGLNPGEENIDPNDPRAYPNRPALQRLATIFAGPGTNYIFAALMMVVIFLIWGVPMPGRTPMVMAVTEGSPAAKAGIEPGVEIMTVDGKKVNEVGEVSPIVDASQGRPIAMEVVQDGKPKTIMVTARQDGSHYRIGVELHPKTVYQPATAGQAIKQGLLFPYEYTRFILHGFAEIFRGKQKAEFSGPIGIVKVMQRQIASGARSAMEIIAIISVYLGLFNLLPLPALDGGRIMFLGWELISRRPVNQRIEQTVHMVGMFVLLGFILFVTLGNDLGLAKLFKH
jgi:regulator of sigma E protease